MEKELKELVERVRYETTLGLVMRTLNRCDSRSFL